MARVEAVHAGRVEVFRADDGQEVESAIRKRAVDGPVEVGRLGIGADEVFERQVHGGPERALHVFARESYAHHEGLAGRALPVPTFGENLTVEGYDDAEARVGDRLRIGTGLFEVSMPTERCAKPGRNVGVPLLLKWIIESGRSGWYLRVLEPGTLRAGDAIEVVERGAEPWTVQRLATALYQELGDEATVSAVRAHPALSEAWKERFETLRKRRQG